MNAERYDQYAPGDVARLVKAVGLPVENKNFYRQYGIGLAIRGRVLNGRSLVRAAAAAFAVDTKPKPDEENKGLRQSIFYTALHYHKEKSLYSIIKGQAA